MQQLVSSEREGLLRNNVAVQEHGGELASSPSAMPLPRLIQTILRCPGCAGELIRDGAGMRCRSCRESYDLTASGSLDLRLKTPKQIALSLTVGDSENGVDKFDGLMAFPACKDPEVNFAASDVRSHVGWEMLSHFSRAKQDTELALDLGCGKTLHRELLEKCGYTYVGADYGHEKAPILADAHALPFSDNSFSFAISVAVLEHLYQPAVALREVYRVLKPGARFIGSVAFLEPFHGNSYYHHTHRGTAHALLTAGFDVHLLGYNRGWIAPISLRQLLFLPRFPRLGRAFVWPLHMASALVWKLNAWARSNPDLLRIYRRNLAGSFIFLASKPEGDRL